MVGSRHPAAAAGTPMCGRDPSARSAGDKRQRREGRLQVGFGQIYAPFLARYTPRFWLKYTPKRRFWKTRRLLRGVFLRASITWRIFLATDKVEWAAVTFEHMFQDQPTRERLKGKVKAVYVIENWFMKDMTPEEKIKKGDEDILILMLATPEDAAAMVNATIRYSKGERKTTMTATMMKGHVPVDNPETVCIHATNISLSDVLENTIKLAKLMAHEMMRDTKQENIDAIMSMLGETKTIKQKTRSGQPKTTDLLFTPIIQRRPCRTRHEDEIPQATG